MRTLIRLSYSSATLILTQTRAQVTSSNFVPTHEKATEDDVAKLSKFVYEASGDLLVMTGAGISTESGLPDYRSEGVGLYARSTRRPIQHMTFLKSEAARKSYWARNFVGWPRWSSVTPNVSHMTLADWERSNCLQHTITQNVDQLHFKVSQSTFKQLPFIFSCLNVIS